MLEYTPIHGALLLHQIGEYTLLLQKMLMIGLVTMTNITAAEKDW